MKRTILFLLVIFTIFTPSCQKDEDTTNVNLKAKFNAEIDGKKVIINENAENYYNPGGFSSISPELIDSLIYGYQMKLGPAHGLVDIKDLIIIELNNKEAFSNLDKNKNINEVQFRSALSTGHYPYSFVPRVSPGAIISYYDSDGVNWISDKYFSSIGNAGDTLPLIPNYSNFTFEITESFPVPPPNVNYIWAQKIELEFNCYLYNINGDSIKVENAYFKGSIPHWNYY